MANIRVWTKQSSAILDALEQSGVHRAKKQHVLKNEDSKMLMEAYDWLAKSLPNQSFRPEGADYPVWLSFSHEAAMLPTPGTVMLELEVDEEMVARVNIAKWSAILNFTYIPKNEKDKRRHASLLEDYGTSDARAFMTPFYPQIKREILESWPRLFDESIDLGGPLCYGNIWEIRKEWIISITQ